MSLPRLMLRLMVAERGMLAGLAALVAATAFLAAAAPAALARMDDDALRAAVRDSPASSRDVTATLVGSARPPSIALLEQVSGLLGDLAGPALREVTISSTYSAHTRQYPTTPEIHGPRGYGVAFRLRLQSGYESRVRFTAGGPPSTVPSTDGTSAGGTPAGGTPTGGTPRFEVALPRLGGRLAGLTVGDDVNLAGAATLHVTGLYEPVDPAASFWALEPSQIRPKLELDPGSPPDEPIYYHVISAMIAPAALPVLEALDPELYQQAPWIAWRLEVDPRRLHAVQVETLRADLDGFASAAVAASPVTPSTGLITVLDTYSGQRATAHAVISLSLSGLLLIALAVLGLAARLLTERRRVSLALLRARGVSLRQLCGLLALEVALVTVPVAGLAVLAADLLLPGRGGGLATVLAFLVAALSILLSPLVAAWEHRRIDRGVRRDLVARRPPRVRLVAELLAVVVAALAVLELRLRGLSTATGADDTGGGADSAAGGSGVDPLLGAVPVLVGLAAAILALRCYPLPVRLLGRLAARRRSAVGFLGLARAGRESPVSALPLVVLVMALTIAVFSGAMRTTVTHGQRVGAWETAGADVRVEGYGDARLPAATATRLAALPGVRAVVGGFNDPAANTLAGQTLARALIVDVPGYGRLLRGSPLGFRFPGALSAPVGKGGVVPVLASEHVADQLAAVTSLEVAGVIVRVRAVGRTAGMPGVGEDDDTLVIPLTGLRAATGAVVEPNVLWLSGEHIRADAVRSTVGGVDPVPVVTTRAEAYDSVHDAPLPRGAFAAFAAGAGLAGGYCLIALGLAVGVGARPREHMLSWLRTLGLSPRQARGLAMLEFAPIALFAVLAGVPVGLALPYLVEPAVRLRPFTGGGREPAVHVEPLAVAATALALVAVVALALLAETAAGRRRSLGSLLRQADED